MTRTIFHLARSYLRDESGLAALEYSVILGVSALIVLPILQSSLSAADLAVSPIAEALSGSPPGTGGAAAGFTMASR